MHSHLVFVPQTSGQTIQVTTGAGTLTMGGNITVSGNNSNPLTISGNLALGASGGVNIINGTNAAPTLTISAIVSGSNALSMQGANTVALTGANTYTGATSIATGTLQVNSLGVSPGETSSSLGAETGTNRTITMGAATGADTLNYVGGATTTDHNIALTVSNTGSNTLNGNGSGGLTWTGTLSGAHSFTLGGTNTANSFQGLISLTAGTLHKAGTGLWAITNAGDTYTEPLSIDQGTLSVPTVNASNTNGTLGNSSQTITVATGTNSATFQYSGTASATTGRNFALSSSGTNTSGFQLLSGPLTLTGTVSGSGTLLKSGTGTLDLTNNTYTGNTTVSAGTLEITNPDLASTSSVTVASSAVLQLNFTDNTVDDDIAALTLGGVSEPAGVYNASDAGPFITGTGNLVIVAPEPSTVGMMMVLGMGVLARRKRRRARGPDFGEETPRSHI